MSDFDGVVLDIDAKEMMKTSSSSGKLQMPFPFFLMMLLKQVNDTSFVEWYGGYNKQQQIVMANGSVMVNEVHVSNTRSVFCNAVMTLYNVLKPRFTKEEADEIKKLNEKIDAFAAHDYETNVVIGPHREMLEIIHYHLARRNYYAGDNFFEDGKPRDPRAPAQLDENGNLIIGQVK
jgi:hypothetical protein